jgi:O-antigen ligase
MTPPQKDFFSHSARWCTFGSAVAILFSIAVSQILLGLALASLLLSGDPLRLPRIKLPLLLFLAGTVVALLFSGEPAHGLAQIKKFYVFGELLVVFSCLREMRVVRWVFLAWGAFAGVDALRGFLQFAAKIHQAHALGIASSNFYLYYLPHRITGFMSHWNTFSEEEMYALLMLAAFLFFSPHARKRAWLWISLLVCLALAVLLAETRGVWIATAAAALYLVWFWQRKLVLAVPVLVAVAFLASPHAIRERFESISRPQQQDSNEFRYITWRTGWEMIKAHPWLGIGPDGPKYHFREYIPADIPRPLPDGFYQHLHNFYLQWAAERGIPVMLIGMWMLFEIPVDFWRGLRQLPPGRDARRFLLHGAIAVWIATMIDGFVEMNLGDTEPLTMFLVVVACGYLALEKNLAVE